VGIASTLSSSNRHQLPHYNTSTAYVAQTWALPGIITSVRIVKRSSAQASNEKLGIFLSALLIHNCAIIAIRCKLHLGSFVCRVFVGVERNVVAYHNELHHRSFPE